jgi:hypothetical protein
MKNYNIFFLLIVLIIFFINSLDGQENNVEDFENDDILKRSIYQSSESVRALEEEKIKIYSDLECTYWAPETALIDDLYTDEGYIFLPNNTVLIVKVIFYPMDDTGTTLKGHYNIYTIHDIYSYEILEEKLVVNTGIPIAFLLDHNLYISYDRINYRKYRLEKKFENFSNLEYSQFEFLYNKD